MRSELREALNVSKTHLFRFMTELTFLEYLQENKYTGNKGNTYQIRYWDDYKKARADVKEFLQNQINHLEDYHNWNATERLWNGNGTQMERRNEVKAL